jgi:hypothetical protein
MPNSNFLQHQTLQVSIGGTIVDRRSVSFRLITQSGFPGVIARLVYPSDKETGSVGDEITVSLANGESTDLYFTGMVYSAKTHGARRELLLTDSYKKLCDKTFTAAYRKEKAPYILDDMLGAAEITQKSLTCPAVELARFSTKTIAIRNGIDLFIDALKEHGIKNLAYFFDEKDVFHFGTTEDTGRNEGVIYYFETGKNILRSGSGWIEVLPCPIRHTQAVHINGKPRTTVKTDVTVSRGLSRLCLWVGENK